VDLLMLYQSGFLMILICVLGGILNHDDLKFLFFIMIDFIILGLSVITIFN